LVGRADCIGAAAKARECLQSFGWSVTLAAELAVVVAELSSNAVRHAGGGECVLEVSKHTWTVTVSDEGPGFPATVLADQGRTDGVGPKVGLGAGLSSARRLSSELTVENLSPKGGRVVARKRSLARKGT
jgi:anti-sigma regulatory factor (Ser/Thr protein kinase)